MPHWRIWSVSRCFFQLLSCNLEKLHQGLDCITSRHIILVHWGNSILICGVRSSVTLDGSFEDAKTKNLWCCVWVAFFHTQGTFASNSATQTPTVIVGVALKTRLTFIYFHFNRDGGKFYLKNVHLFLSVLIISSCHVRSPRDHNFQTFFKKAFYIDMCN